MELNRLSLKLVLLCQVHIQESFREDNSKLNFLGIIWKAKGPREHISQAFKEPKIQNFGKHGATSRICWVYYKPPISSYSEVGMYVDIVKNEKNKISANKKTS